MKFTTKSCWLSSSHSNIGGISSRRSPSSHRLVRSQELGVLHDDQEVNSSSGSLVLGIVRVRLLATHRPGKLNGRADSLSRLILERCKRELKHFRFRDNSFLRILEDGKSTAAYVTTDKRVDVMKHYHTSLAHLKYGSIIDLLLRRFWWPSMKKDLKDFIARCPECQLDRSSSGIHAPLPIRPVPPVALPFERWGSISMVQWPRPSPGTSI
ncbi:hypothetical protein BASA83_007665 [Batrachochytrium salamandrivorans]|nr:hypothetical protein BASA83_007665 [Batrachochytrium salamandrivorans]